jgi:hypothetical protein
VQEAQVERNSVMSVNIDITDSELNETKTGIITLAKVLANELAERDFKRGVML